MKKIKSNLIFISIIMIFIIVLAVVTYTVAWLIDSDSFIKEGETSTLKIEYLSWFEQDNNPGFGSSDIAASEYFLSDSVNEENNLNVVKMSLGDKTAPNYIGKLRFSINVNTNSEYYIRIKIKNEFFVEKTSRSTQIVRYNTLTQSEENMMPYNLEADWYYDPVSHYLYYNTKITSDSVIKVIDKEMTTIIDYLDSTTTTYINKYFVYLDLELEYVQANRMKAIWGFDEIPKAP